MYSKSSILKDINIISKFISLIFITLIIFYVNNKYVLISLGLLFVIFEKYNFISIIALVLTFLNIFFNVNIFSKIGLFIVYLDLFRKIIDFIEYRYLIEDMFYRTNSKIVYKFVSLYYYFKYFKVNYRNMTKSVRGYGFKMNFKLFKFVLKESLNKTSLYVKNIMLNYKYKFYGISRKRTYYEKDVMDSYDYKYLLCHVIIFLICYIYWR